MLEVWRGDALIAQSSDRRAANVNAAIIVDYGVYVIGGDVVGCCTRRYVDNISELSKVAFVIFDQLHMLHTSQTNTVQPPPPRLLIPGHDLLPPWTHSTTRP